jgi:radical SAM superfamily enzyme YgiQ (UPF0313 family)
MMAPLMYQRLCDTLGFRYFIPPLGLLTVAALLPKSWDIRLVDRNVRALTRDDIDWADIVMTGGMLTQQNDSLDIVAMAQSRGKPVVVGGPDVTSSPAIYRQADFQVLGEAESVMEAFIAAWDAGARTGIFEAKKFTTDVRRSPVPRYDLVDVKDYVQLAVQFSRGCPFTCEFCDIIELYGRVPRAKTPQQVLAELDSLYRLGYRGSIFFVDDNLIGNKKEFRLFLPLLIAWQKEHGHPFELSTQATINLGDDPELLKLMAEANFITVFFGIESPDPETLIAARKKQNAIRNLTQSIAKVHAAGMFATAGIILGFDGEKGSVADGIIQFIESGPIAVFAPGLLLALPDTQLSRRLIQEGRLHSNSEANPKDNQTANGLNFETRRPRRDILTDYIKVLDTLFAPEAYFSRLRKQACAVRRPRLKTRKRKEARLILLLAGKLMKVLWTMSVESHPVRTQFWSTLFSCLRSNPRTIKYVVANSVAYLDFGPLTRRCSDEIRQQIALIDRGAWRPEIRGAGRPESAAADAARLVVPI